MYITSATYVYGFTYPGMVKEPILEATVNQHPPAHEEGWMISG